MKIQLALASAILFATQLSTAAPPADNLLAGPTIVDEELSEKDMRSRKLQESGISVNVSSREQNRIWLATIRALDLTEQQSKALLELRNEMQTAQDSYRNEYGKEIKTLRSEQAAAKKSGDVSTDESRKRMVELLRFAPDIVSFQERGWALLTESQQVEFRSSYQLRLAEEQKKRDERKAMGMQTDTKLRDLTPKSPTESGDETVSRGKRKVQNGGDVDDASLRKIRFLQRLQNLKKD